MTSCGSGNVIDRPAPVGGGVWPRGCNWLFLWFWKSAGVCMQSLECLSPVKFYRVGLFQPGVKENPCFSLFTSSLMPHLPPSHLSLFLFSIPIICSSLSASPPAPTQHNKWNVLLSLCFPVQKITNLFRKVTPCSCPAFTSQNYQSVQHLSFSLNVVRDAEWERGTKGEKGTKREWRGNDGAVVREVVQEASGRTLKEGEQEGKEKN